MKAKHIILILCFHAGLLILASTRFTVLSWIWNNGVWTWDYFQYNFQNGWGYKYQSSYSLAVVLTYIVAYLVGIIGFCISRKYIANGWKVLAIILNGLGLISFLIEGSHWLWTHHLSWIISCPVACLLLVIVGIFQLRRAGIRTAEPIVALNPNPDNAPPVSVN
jgi:hypothetical protein